MSNLGVSPPETLPSERRIIAAIWPALLASAVGLLPFTVFSTAGSARCWPALRWPP